MVAIYLLCSVDCSLGVIYVSLYDILVLQHEVVSDTMTFGDRLIRLLPIFLVIITPICKSNWLHFSKCGIWHVICHADAQYRYGDIRLVGGSYQWEGRVEIFIFGIWGTITDSEWTNNDAQVVCRKLGHFKPGTESTHFIYVVTVVESISLST